MMRIRKLVVRHWLAFALILTTGPLLFMGCAQQPSNSNTTDAYDYPVKGGTEEWKSFSPKQMLEACQIPEPTLKKMSTAGLVETVLNYPLLGNMFAHNYPQQGFEAVTDRFNGLEELLQRKDAGVELLARYRAMDPLAIEEDWESVQIGAYIVSFRSVETILAQDPILANLTASQLQELLAVTLERYRAKQQLADIYGTSLECTVWLIGKALQQEGYPPFKQQIRQDTTLQSFLDKGSFADDALLKEIVLHAEQFLSGK